VRSARRPREAALLLISLSGLGILPLVFIATGIPHFASYTFPPPQGWFDPLVAVAALVMFQLTHRRLAGIGRSVSMCGKVIAW
jgi:hypothetical protein